jgi:DNA repair exonuclease SbcCD ATPase subunit
MGLPAAREAVTKAEAERAAAEKALTNRQAELKQPALADAVTQATQALESASYPHRPRAAELRAEAGRVQAQIATVNKQMVQLQQAIARAEGNKAARNRDFWRDDHYDGWDAVGDLLGSAGDASTIKQARAKINKLIEERVALEGKVVSLTVEASTLDNQLGDPAAIEAAKAALRTAEGALARVESQLAPEKAALGAAQGALAKAKGKQAELEALKSDLQDYSNHFPFGTRAKLMFSDFGWKKDLDAFFKAQGL